MENNFVLRVKKAVKKITAITTSAVMAGTTMVGALAAADLANLPAPFISNGNFDSYVLVGSGSEWNTQIAPSAAIVNDVVGAIIVASAFAQQATTAVEATVEGNAVVERNVTPGYLTGSGPYLGMSEDDKNITIGTWTKGAMYNNSNTGFSWLANLTLYNTTSNTAGGWRVIENLEVNPYAVQIKRDGTAQVRATGKIIYNITLNVTGVISGTGSSASNGLNSSQIKGVTGFPFMGGSYQIVDANTTWENNVPSVELGTVEQINATINQQVSVGEGGSVTPIDIDSLSNRVQIVVRDDNGNIISTDWYNVGESYSSSELKFTVRDITVSAITGEASVQFDWQIVGMVFLNGYWNWTDEYTDWRVSTDGWSYLALMYSPETSTITNVGMGSNLSFFGGWFSLQYQGLRQDNDDGDLRPISASEFDTAAPEVTYIDENGTTHYMDLSDVSESISGDNTTATLTIQEDPYIVECDTDTNLVYTTLQNGTIISAANNSPFVLGEGSNDQRPTCWYNVTFADTACTGKINFTVMNCTSDGGAGDYIGDNLTYIITVPGWMHDPDGAEGDLSFVEPNGNTTSILYNVTSGSIKKVSMPHDNDISTGTYYSNFGSQIVYSSGSVDMQVPEYQRRALVYVGKRLLQQWTLEAGDYNSELDLTLVSSVGGSTCYTVNDVSVDFAMVDTEASTNKPVILLGGPAVNQKVSELAASGMTWTASDYTMNHALIDFIEDAYGAGRDALIIAGYGAEDTIIAAQVVASQVLGTDVLAGNFQGARVVLDTSAGSYQGVSVVST